MLTKHLSFILVPSMALSLSLSAADIDMDLQPGGLGDAISGISFTPGSSLRLRGAADIRDLITLREQKTLPGELDLSGLSISEYACPKAVYAGRSLFMGHALPAYIFFKAPYSRIILPADLVSIEDGAFAGSSVKSVVIPEGVTSIGEYAFYGCPDLESVSFPSTLRSIGRGAFAGCPKLTVADLSECQIPAIPDRCFADDYALADVAFPSQLVSVGTEAFAHTSVSELSLPGVRRLAPYALADMPALSRVTLNKDASFSEGTLMNNGKLGKITGAPSSLPELFAANCYSVEPSEVMEGVNTVGRHAFANASVSTLVLASSLAYIDAGAFAGMTALDDISATGLGADMPEVSPEAFGGLDPAKIKLKVDDNTEEAWRSHPVWGRFDIYSDLTTSVDGVVPDEDSSAISVRVSGDNLIVEASSVVKAGTVYAGDGRRLCTVTAGDTRTETSLQDISDKVIVVTVVTEEGRKTFKILKN